MIDFKTTQLLGHRGARHEAPENTLFGFEYANTLQKHGLNGVEFDVQLTADGHLIVFHDETLQRLCGIPSRVNQLTLREIRRYSQFGHPIITLEHLIAAQLPTISSNLIPHSHSTVLTGYTHIELEVKTHDRTDYRLLMAALARSFSNPATATLPITLTSFDTELLAKLQNNQLLNTVPRSLLIRTPERLATAANNALQLGCRQLGVYYPLLTQTLIQSCHRYGLPVSAWTVNDYDYIQQLITWQVDFIITDTPLMWL